MKDSVAVMTYYCAIPGCGKPAEIFACGRPLAGDTLVGHPEPNWYCRPHAALVIDEGNPEYNTRCPHCGCHFGVG